MKNNCYNCKCRKEISDQEYEYSQKNFHKPLCKKHQPTIEAEKLGKRLENFDWSIEFEKWDGHKHIDLAIVDKKINIEVDGKQHRVDKNQALRDLERMYYSFKAGFLTLRISNILVEDDEILNKTAGVINKFLKETKKRGTENYAQRKRRPKMLIDFYH
jgi:very-short-patch-repair endonuclease